MVETLCPKRKVVTGDFILFYFIQEELNARLDYVNRYNKSLAEKAAEQFKRFEEMLELKQRQEKQKLDEQLEKEWEKPEQ